MATYINGKTVEDARSLARGVTITEIQNAIAGLQSDHSMSILSTNDAVYADGQQGLADPEGTQSGWFFKNSEDLTNKINWYYLTNQNPSNPMTIGTLSAMYAVIRVRAGFMPYFIFYTSPEGAGDAASWYRSRIVMSNLGDMSAYVGQDVLLHFGDVTGILPSLPRIECTSDSFGTVGLQGADESIAFGALSTSSSYPAGTYEFVASQVGYINAANNTQIHLLHQDTPEVAPVGYSNTHYVTLDATNDYIDLTTPNIEIDFNKSWTVAVSIDSVSSVNDSSYITLLSSGGNSVNLRKGGTNWGIYVSTPTGNVWQANTWHAPVAGSKIIIRCNGGVGMNYYLHNAHDGGMWVTGGNFNTTYLAGNAPETNKIELGKGGNLISAHFTAGYWFGGLNDVTVWNDYISDEMLSEYLSSDDVTSHSYYAADVTDFLPLGEDVYPAVNGLKGAITGTLLNGTPEDFLER